MVVVLCRRYLAAAGPGSVDAGESERGAPRGLA